MKFLTKINLIKIGIVLGFFVILLIFMQFINTKSVVSDEAVKIAEDYIVSKVGEEYFNKYYVLRRDLSAECCIFFDFIPAQSIGSQKRIMVSVKKKSVEYANGVFNCLKNRALCELKINKNQALQIAKDQGFYSDGENENEISIDLYQTSSNLKEDQWAWTLSRKSFSGNLACENLRLMEIGASTGEYSTIGNKTICH